MSTGKTNKSLKAATGGRGWLNVRAERAFTRVDLVVVIVVVALLLGWLTGHLTGERGRIFRCAHNLKQLGQAMQEYAGDHGGKLPPAVFAPTATTWDLAIMRYLRPGLFKTNSAYADRQLREAVASRFLCPSDKLSRFQPRTYVMSEFKMEPDNWPPGAGNITGVGLVWNDQQAEKVMDKSRWERGQASPDNLPGVKLTALTAPDQTVLLTELVNADNQIGSVAHATVGSGQEQSDQFQGDRTRFHYGGFNYLMADGHVELKSSATASAGGKVLPEPFDFNESDDTDGAGVAKNP